MDQPTDLSYVDWTDEWYEPDESPWPDASDGSHVLDFEDAVAALEDWSVRDDSARISGSCRLLGR